MDKNNIKDTAKMLYAITEGPYFAASYSDGSVRDDEGKSIPFDKYIGPDDIIKHYEKKHSTSP